MKRPSSTDMPALGLSDEEEAVLETEPTAGRADFLENTRPSSLPRAALQGSPRRRGSMTVSPSI